MRVPGTSSSSLFPSWITKMTLGSLFISLFGISLFSVCLLGTQNVDVLTLLTMSEGMPNPMEFFQVLTKMLNKLTSWIPNLSIPDSNIPVVEFFTYVINLLLKIIQGILYIISAIPVLLFSIVFIPIYLAIWLVDTTGVLFSAINGTSWTHFNMQWLIALLD